MLFNHKKTKAIIVWW